MPEPVVAPALLVDGPDGPRLRAGHCMACDRPHVPVADGCPWCGATAIRPAAIGATARLWLWTGVAAAPPGYEGALPFGFGVVTLDDAPLRVVARLTEADPARLHEGQSMRLVRLPIGTDSGGAPVDVWAYAPVEPR